MAWSAPRSWTDGEIVQGSYAQQNWHDDMLEAYVAKMQAAGDIAYATGANALARLPIGTGGQVLGVNSGATAPEWTDADPWRIDIEPLGGGEANTGWNTLQNTTGDAYFGALKTDNGNQNNLVDFTFVVQKGTYTITLMHVKNTDHGIYSVQVDAVEVGTVDGYNGSRSPQSIGSVTGVAIATGKHTLRLKMATKNASSSNYYGEVQHILVRRTA